jgi:signal transduction histidine kinase
VFLVFLLFKGGTIDRAHHLARNGLDEARRAISMLRGDELPGPERIEAMAAEFARDSAIPCRFEIGGEPRDIGSETRLALYRAAQEALTNIRKHADAERALVTLIYEPYEVRLVIEDTSAAAAPGPGPESNGHRGPAAGSAGAGPLVSPGILAGPDGTGYGLTGMRERAELLGGTLTAAPTGHGFRVELRVPG